MDCAHFFIPAFEEDVEEYGYYIYDECAQQCKQESVHVKLTPGASAMRAARKKDAPLMMRTKTPIVRVISGQESSLNKGRINALTSPGISATSAYTIQALGFSNKMPGYW